MPILIDKKEVLRYLGYNNQDIDTSTSKLIKESIKEIKDISIAKSIYREFEIKPINGDIRISSSDFSLKGSSIKEHLKDSDRIILLALSLGHEVDRMIRYYEKTNMARAVILDACASAAIEAYANSLSSRLEEDYLRRGEKLTGRFSPGYGDLDIGIQGDFLNLLDAGKSIGLTATSRSILIPRKSITAIIGIIDKDISYKKMVCEDCPRFKDCIYARGDDGCGN